MSSLVGMFLPLFCVVYLETSNGLLLNRLLIVPGVERSMLLIGVNLCLFVLRPTESMVVQENRIMNAPRNTLALQLFPYAVVGDTERLDLWCETFYSFSQGARGRFGGDSY